MTPGARRLALPLFLCVVTAIRLAVAAAMPLSADEAYYRVWAHALAPGYLDHPPMVALWIRAGIALAGDSAFGARLLAPISALLGSLLLIALGNDLAGEKGPGARAAWLLNGTVLLNAGAVVMTPDTPLLLFWTAALAAVGRVYRTGNGLWWLAAGAAAGLAFDSKYTAAFLAPCIFIWLLAVPAMRHWLRRWHLWAAALIVVAIVAPVLAWNEAHGWVSFLRQGGRVADWNPARAASFLGEFVAGQVGLATPVTAALAALGVWRCARQGAWRRPAEGLIAATTLLPALVFLQHALGGRVQANWPSILYPTALLAIGLTVRQLWRTAAAVGLALSALLYLQAAAAPFSLPRRLDFTLIRLGGWADLAAQAEAARQEAGADCIAADEYGLAAELAFHLTVPVLGVEPRWSQFDLPPAPAACRHVILVRSLRRAGAPDPKIWQGLAGAGSAARARGGVTAEGYALFRAAMPAGAVLLPSRLSRL